MPLTNAERQKRYREKQLLHNKEDYDKKISLKMKKHYRKIKNEEIIINNHDNHNNNEEKIEYNKDNDFIFIQLKPIKKRINPLNKSKLNDKSIQLYLKTIKKIYKNYYKKDIDDDTDLLNILTNKPYNLDKITLQLQFLKTDLYNVIKDNYKDITILYAVITRIKNFAKQVKQLYPYIEQKQNNYNEKRITKKPDMIIEHKIETLSFKKEDILSILYNQNLHLTDN